MPRTPKPSPKFTAALAKAGLHFNKDGDLYDQTVEREPVPPSVNRAAKRLKRLTRENRGSNERRYPWDQMEHGDSFLVGTAQSRRAARSSLVVYLKTRRCHLDGEHFMVSERVPEGFRCWLIAADRLPPGNGEEPIPTVEKNHPIPNLEG